MGILDVFSKRGSGSPEPPAAVPPAQKPSVAVQVQTLSRLGLEPQDGVTAEVIAQDPEAAAWVRRHPYAALVHCLARDPDGDLTHHPKVVHIDPGFVKDADSYPAVLRRLAEAAGTSDLLQDVSGELDRDHDRCVLRFTVDGLTREIHPRLNHDRADLDVMQDLYEAVSGPGQRHAQIGHGQDVTVAYVPARHAAELQRVFDTWAWSW